MGSDPLKNAGALPARRRARAGADGAPPARGREGGILDPGYGRAGACLGVAQSRCAAQGIDLADALHLVLSGKAERFATFDEALVKQARKLGVQPPVSAP